MTTHVWVTIPSARPVAEVAKWAAAWRERGYKIALWRDDLHETIPAGVADSVLCWIEYPGYARAVNVLVHAVCCTYPDAEWFVIGGDDVFPDPNHTAEEIAEQLGAHFGSRRSAIISGDCDSRGFRPDTHTFGVMQPTGDRWGENPNHPRPDMRSAYIDRVCGSAWLGREFCRRLYGGNGPLWPEFEHMFVDEHLFRVANKLGVYWPRQDLTHYHAHAGRVKHYTSEMIPPHLKKWSSAEHWKEAETIFRRLEAGGFAEADDLLREPL